MYICLRNLIFYFLETRNFAKNAQEASSSYVIQTLFTDSQDFHPAKTSEHAPSANLHGAPAASGLLDLAQNA